MIRPQRARIIFCQECDGVTRLVREDARVALQYTPCEGIRSVREYLIDRQEQLQGRRPAVAELIVTSGGMECIALACAALVDPGDNIGLFGWLPHDVEVAFARWLMLREPSQLPSGRVPLYICPECGDLGCQSLSARVVEEPDRFVWTEFAYEANYDAGPATQFLAVRPFSVEKRAYTAVLGRFTT